MSSRNDLMDFETVDTTIDILGEPKIDSPLLKNGYDYDSDVFVDEENRVLIHVNEKSIQRMLELGKKPPAFEVAGPRRKIYFDPSKIRCALVTCGGLCPGLNDIIRSVVLELYHRYGVKRIYGIKYGLQGFMPEYGHDVMELEPESVVRILDRGGSILGSSRGPQNVDDKIGRASCRERVS
jgi:6-phosphofructokinase 1